MSEHDEIARRAFQLYEERGCVDGHDCDDWFEAERELSGGNEAADNGSSPSRRRRDLAKSPPAPDTARFG